MTWIERTARRKSIEIIVFSLVVTAIVVWIYAENAAYWKVFIFGPPPAGVAQLDAASTAAANYQTISTPWVTLTGGKMIDTGVQQVTTYEGFIHHVSAGYYAMQIGDRVLIVKSGKQPAATVSGALSPMPYDLKSDLFPQGTDPVVIAQVYPLLLDTNYREGGWAACFWVLLLEALFGFFAWHAWRRLTRRVEYPVLTRAKAWGDLQVTSADLERELQMAVKAKSKGWTLTQNYVMKSKMFTFDLYRLENLVWGYKKAVKRRLYYIIPAGTTYAAELHFSDGSAHIEGKQAKVDELLTLASQRSPWAIRGYSADLQKLFNSSRKEFVAEVMERKAGH